MRAKTHPIDWLCSGVAPYEISIQGGLEVAGPKCVQQELRPTTDARSSMFDDAPALWLETVPVFRADAAHCFGGCRRLASSSKSEPEHGLAVGIRNWSGHVRATFRLKALRAGYRQPRRVPQDIPHVRAVPRALRIPQARHRDGQRSSRKARRAVDRLQNAIIANASAQQPMSARHGGHCVGPSAAVLGDPSHAKLAMSPDFQYSFISRTLPQTHSQPSTDPFGGTCPPFNAPKYSVQPCGEKPAAWRRRGPWRGGCGAEP